MTECSRIRSGFDDFIDGTLSAAQAEAISTHVLSCGECRGELGALRATIALIKAAPTPESAHSRILVMNRFRSAISSERGHRRRPGSPWRLWSASVGVAAAAAFALLLIGNPVIHIANRSRPVATGAPPALSVSDSELLPSQLDLDQMSSKHSLESFTLSGGEDDVLRDSLADVTSRLNRRQQAR